MRRNVVFSYVDKRIKEQLLEDGKLIFMNEAGEQVGEECCETPVISLMGPIPVPISNRGEEIQLNWYPFVRRVELKHVLDSAQKVDVGGGEAFRTLLQERMSVNSVLATPNFAELENPLVRIHSCCMTGDAFGSMRCECGPQLEMAFERISKEGGAVIYMSSHEGRGIGLWAKAVTYMLQDQGEDTYQANVSLGLPEDSRDFSDAASVLRYLLQNRPIRLMTNNPMKHEQLEAAGQRVSEMVRHVTGIGQHNRRYMNSKKEKGHKL